MVVCLPPVQEKLTLQSQQLKKKKEIRDGQKRAPRPQVAEYTWIVVPSTCSSALTTYTVAVVVWRQ